MTSNNEKMELKKMHEEIISLKKIILSVKEEMEDRFLTAEEKEDIQECLKESDAGETYSLEEVKKELCQK